MIFRSTFGTLLTPGPNIQPGVVAGLRVKMDF
jgi:hypothetical protein